MTKWTWLIVLAIALVGGGYYLSSYQNTKEAAPALPPGQAFLGGDDADNGEESAELDKDTAGFDATDEQESATPLDDSSLGLGLGGQEGSTAADREPIDDQDNPSAALKDAAAGGSPLPQEAAKGAPATGSN